jgi:AcrB/AcrD/AcrF family protein
MMISHFDHLVAVERMEWEPDAALRGAAERLTPVLMTALVTALGLLPIALGSGEAGREIEGPMAIVILGGLPAFATLAGCAHVPLAATSQPPADRKTACRFFLGLTARRRPAAELHSCCAARLCSRSRSAFSWVRVSDRRRSKTISRLERSREIALPA